MRERVTRRETETEEYGVQANIATHKKRKTCLTFVCLLFNVVENLKSMLNAMSPAKKMINSKSGLPDFKSGNESKSADSSGSCLDWHRFNFGKLECIVCWLWKWFVSESSNFSNLNYDFSQRDFFLKMHIKGLQLKLAVKNPTEVSRIFRFLNRYTKVSTNINENMGKLSFTNGYLIKRICKKTNDFTIWQHNIVDTFVWMWIEIFWTWNVLMMTEWCVSFTPLLYFKNSCKNVAFFDKNFDKNHHLTDETQKTQRNYSCSIVKANKCLASVWRGMKTWQSRSQLSQIFTF